jgi:hypothetical protein
MLLLFVIVSILASDFGMRTRCHFVQVWWMCLAWCRRVSQATEEADTGAKFASLIETTMCPRFPPEIPDYIVDILHDKDERETLKQCCLVSKSWVPRARKHLFAAIKFKGFGYFERWKEMFPDPTDSPACYARSLSFVSKKGIPDVAEEDRDWIREFCNVVRLELHYGTRKLCFCSPQQLLTGDKISPRS